jgi:hypothetical protein
MSIRAYDLTSIKTPADDHLVADLARLGVLFLRTRATQRATPPLAPATLLAGLAASTDARVRLALIPLLLARPDYADFLPDALPGLSAAAQVVLRCYATAAVVLQAQHAVRLHALFGAQPCLHDWFSAELGMSLSGSPDEQLAWLAARHRQRSGRSRNWVGTYRHGAESFLRFMEQEQRWGQLGAVARTETPVVYSDGTHRFVMEDEPMPLTITREQIWEKLDRLDSFQQQSVVAFIDSLLQPKTPTVPRDKSWLLALSAWTDEDIARVHKAQDEINAWHFPAF